MEHKHTPGPWKVCRANPSPTTGEWMIAGAEPGYLAEVRDLGRGQCEANARLIAVAPDLYKRLLESTDMLERILADKEWGSIEEQIIDNRAAIAKATGEQE